MDLNPCFKILWRTVKALHTLPLKRLTFNPLEMCMQSAVLMQKCFDCIPKDAGCRLSGAVGTA